MAVHPGLRHRHSPLDEDAMTAVSSTPASAPSDMLAETQHTMTIDGQELAYTVTTGTIVLKEERERQGEQGGQSEGEQPIATIFFVAYSRDGQLPRSERPITFAFNGGPGSSSVWLHLGMLGPERVRLDPIGNPLPPPGHLVPNPYTLLTHTDLVFIDPISTGYSRVVSGMKANTFHGFKKDIESVGDFIRLYTTRYQRWSSPKFLIGESYGTTRAAGLSGYLQDRHGLYLNGIMLVSSILNFQTALFDPGNDLPFVLYLPTYTATAWYHKKLAPELQKNLPATLREAEAFALGDYAQALLLGAALPEETRAQVAEQLARFTGLDQAYVERCDLRINIFRFVKELLRDERRTVGRLDSRFKGIDRDSAGESYEFDPSYANIQGPYTAAFYDYVRGELKFESDLPYEILTERVGPWSYATHENQYVNVAETLRRAISTNPYLKVFVANGYYDLATPYYATRYTVNHLGLDPSLSANISLGFYEAGHMMYVHLPSLARLREDLADFLAGALPPK